MVLNVKDEKLCLKHAFAKLEVSRLFIIIEKSDKTFRLIPKNLGQKVDDFWWVGLTDDLYYYNY